jgi:spermidine/putrescine transport system permease protein
VTSAPAPEARPRDRHRLLEKVVLLGPGLLFTAVFVAVPVLLVLSYTVFDRGRFGGVVYDFGLDNFSRAFEPTYRKVLVSSIWIAGLTTLIALALGYPVAYAIAKLPDRWRNVALVLVVVPFWTNFLIRTYAWITILKGEGLLNNLLMWAQIISEPLPLLYTPTAVLIGTVYAYLPFMILPIYGSVEKLDNALIDAAMDLGANPVRAFANVIVPLTRPGIVAGILLVFVPAVGMFAINDILGGKKEPLIGNLIDQQFKQARNMPFGSALGILLLVLFAVAFFLSLKRRQER